jgi:hypothetical protein
LKASQSSSELYDDIFSGWDRLRFFFVCVIFSKIRNIKCSDSHSLSSVVFTTANGKVGSALFVVNQLLLYLKLNKEF